MAEEGFVYIINLDGSYLSESIEGPDPRLNKIGSTSNLSARIDKFQTGSPYRINLNLKKGPTPYYESLETVLHKHFEPQRLHGEWFFLEKEDLTFIENLDLPSQQLEPSDGKPHCLKRKKGRSNYELFFDSEEKKNEFLDADFPYDNNYIRKLNDGENWQERKANFSKLSEYPIRGISVYSFDGY